MSLFGSSAYIGFGWYLNSAAESLVEQQLVQENVQNAEIAAFPTIFQVHYRRVVVRTPDEDRAGFISMWHPCEIDWGRAPRVDDVLTAAYDRSREGSIFKWFTMGWLHYEANPTPSGYQLSAIDLRYGATNNPRESMFTSSAKLNTLGQLLGAPTAGGFRPSANRDSISRLLTEIYSPTCIRDKVG